MSMDTIEKTGLTQVPVNFGHNGCFTSIVLDNFCLIFVFKHSINYEINKIQKRKNTVCLRVLLKRKAYLMPMILINNIFVITGARVCKNILLGVNNVKVDFMQVALNQHEM